MWGCGPCLRPGSLVRGRICKVLDSGADPNFRDSDGYMALHITRSSSSSCIAAQRLPLRANGAARCGGRQASPGTAWLPGAVGTHGGGWAAVGGKEKIGVIWS